MDNLSASWRDASIAHVTLRRGASAPDSAALWPDANRFSESASLLLANVAPNAALAIGAVDDALWFEMLQARFSNAAIVTDQSSAYRILRLNGAPTRELLASGVFIDLDPSVFSAGAAQALRCGHIAVILLHRTEGAFEILVPRSYVDSFLHWLKASVAMRNLTLTGI